MNSFDITEDFGENHWRWEDGIPLDLSAIRQFKLFAPDSATHGTQAVGLGAISFEPPGKSEKPAIMLATCRANIGDPVKAYRIIPHLRAAGYEVCVKYIYGVGSATYLAADQLARFNAVILLDLPYAEKGGYPKNFDRVAGVLHEYVESGGGLLFTAIPGGWNNIMGCINTFLSDWGARCLDEQIVDPESVAQSDAWFRRYPFCWTDNVAPHPVTEGVTGTWYPAKAWRADGILTTIAYEVDDAWQVLLRGRDSARSIKPKGGEFITQPAGSIASAPPILSVRDVGKGRVGVLPIYPSFLTGGCDHPSWNSMVWDGEAKGLKSDMKALFLNTMKWLAEPSVQIASLGGYKEPTEAIDYRPMHERPIPLDWTKTAFREPSHQDYLVLVGAQSDLTGGANTPQEMIAAAKDAGYQVVAFTEPVAGMDAEKWQALCEACAAGSDEEMPAIPGLRYQDPQGNSYLLFGTFEWPDETWYAKCFNEAGQVIDTYALYAKVSGWRHVAIHTLGKNPNPVLHQRHYSCVSVFTYDGDTLIDDAYDDYLLLEENCYYPVPLAVHFVDSVEEVRGATAGFQTRLWAKSPAHARELLDDGKAGSSYFWNPKPTYLSSGPRLLDWQELNMNSWRATAPGTDKWQFRLALDSEAPLTSVRIMDGTHLYREFRPNAPVFTREHTGHHGKQNQFTIRAKDAAGGELVSSHLKTHTMEHVFFMCGDRQNSLGEGSWGYQPWPAQYKTAPDVDISEMFPPHWDGGSPGFSSFCVATINPAQGTDAAQENNLGMLASSKRTLMSSRDCTITEEVGDGKFLDRHAWGDCKPTPALLPREFITDRVRKTHYRVAENSTGFMLVEGQVQALKNLPVPADPGGIAVRFYALGDHGSKGGELQYFAYTAPDGSRIVRHTPDGIRYFATDGQGDVGDYFGTFPRRMGAPALFPLTPVNWHLHGASNIFGMTFGTGVPDGEVNAGDSWDYRFLFASFTSAPGELNETPERIRLMYGLAGDPGYAFALKTGELLGTVYELRLRAADGAASVALEQADLPGALPIAVENLNDRWSAVVAEGDDVRFIGVFEECGFTVADIREKSRELFVGHPVICGDARLFLELSGWGESKATVEVHNPTDAPIETWVAVAPACPFIVQDRRTVTVPAGTSVMVGLGGEG